MNRKQRNKYRKTVEYENNLSKAAGEVKGLTIAERRRIANRVKGIRLVKYMLEKEYSSAEIRATLKKVKPNALELIEK